MNPYREPSPPDFDPKPSNSGTQLTGSPVPAHKNQGLSIILDIDGVVADFNGALYKALADEGALGYSDEQFTTWELKACIKPEHHRLLERISTRRGFCTSIQRYDGAQTFYKRLRKHGRVMAVTTAWHAPSWEQERYDWLLSFGFADPEIHIVFKLEEKLAVPCDIVIEDRIETLRKFPDRVKKILIDRPWNQQTETRDQTDMVLRAHSYNHVLAFVKAISLGSGLSHERT